MRCIDADALETHEQLEPLGNGEYEYVEVVYKDDIDDAPTIEPRKKGKWIIKDNPGTGWYRITCSECGEDVTSTAPCIGFYPNAKVMWDFCPNCGADMREPEDIPMEYFESGGR